MIDFFSVQAFVLGKHRELLPIGVPGEIFVTGRQLARGYWGRPEDGGAERIVPNPYLSSREDVWLFQTGDFGRWTPTGNLVLCGTPESMKRRVGLDQDPAKLSQPRGLV